jgi:vacuolar protein-sorting-associated protein 4
MIFIAMRRRFEKRVYIALPEPFARAKMFKLNLGDTPNDITEQQFEQMGEMSEGYSGSDIAVVVREALMEPLRKCQTAKQFMLTPTGFYIPCENYPNCPHCPMNLSTSPVAEKQQCTRCGAIRMSLYAVPGDKLQVPVVTYMDFVKALNKAHSSVGQDELQKFVSWTEEFGQEG